ncbi:Pyridoxal-dependent decarboxylase [Sulfidibacter corallicola]|uniref:Pyridoxal-dependent decarboxylase n=1 Tax=Sulfidibacter corallicola TaxID=2818388 RepID=A0A8A4TQP4_SULCO|nr:pyridoxal-dependent decarboxylase [Sulfidibacter corallicola]QTD51504.1 hypothetical protein J3U87_03465 [Sulfidibacter corallicola]
MMDLNFLHPYFLGPKAENLDCFERFLLEFLRDHAYWRRNFHPGDGNVVPTSAPYRDAFQDFIASMRKELQELSAELKNAAPFYSPRYIGHMNSDLLMPGLLAEIMTMLYNPNNVAAEAGPATVPRELEVGWQLARMFGYNTDPQKGSVVAWGHLTSGGTIANYEGLWNFREVKFYPIALATAARVTGIDFESVGPLRRRLSEYSSWELVNFSIQDTVKLLEESSKQVNAMALSDGELQRFRNQIDRETLVGLGHADFFAKHREIRPPKVVVPITAHYSWDKAVKVLGLGLNNLVLVKTDKTMRMRMDHLQELLAGFEKDRVPVLAVVGVLGSTEFSSIDPIDQIIDLRDEAMDRGTYFGVHIDAAWGGYMCSLFRREETNQFCQREEVGEDLKHFPSEDTYEAFKAVGESDSITVDPHKLGFLPYPCGAFVARNMDVVDFISQKASYLYDIKDDRGTKNRYDKLLNLGQFIMEGSKPGAAAAAAYVSHRVIPLNKHHFGRIVKVTIKSCEYFYSKINHLAYRMKKRVLIKIPFFPQTNIICFAINPKNNRHLALMNFFGRKVFEKIKINRFKPLQMKEFIGSYTSMVKGKIDDELASEVLADLDIDPQTFQTDVIDPRRQADHIFLFRHSLMSPWLLHRFEGKNYIDHYVAYLERMIHEELDALGESS